MGIKYEKPVNVANKMVVLMGVRVAHALMAAIQLIMANVRFVDGKK
jgi:hypothetical protein